MIMVMHRSRYHFRREGGGGSEAFQIYYSVTLTSDFRKNYFSRGPLDLHKWYSFNDSAKLSSSKFDQLFCVLVFFVFFLWGIKTIMLCLRVNFCICMY